jgi:hypothetical protein
MDHREADAHAAIPPKKQFLSEEQLMEIWDTRGLKYRFDEFHELLLNRGLQPYVDRPRFQKMVMDILRSFLVNGDARRDPRRVPMQRFPKVH